MNQSFTDMAATAFAFANVTGDGPPEIVLGRRVTPNFFSVLGVQPVIGRAFTTADDTNGSRVVVISHALWQRRYGGDPGIIGRMISMSVERVGDVKHEVIGVARRRCLPQPSDRLLGPDAVRARGGLHARQSLPRCGRPP